METIPRSGDTDDDPGDELQPEKRVIFDTIRLSDILRTPAGWREEYRRAGCI